MVAALLDHVGDVLTEQGESDLVASLWTRLAAGGNGAREQRRWATGGLAEVLRLAGEATLAPLAFP